MPKVPLSPGPGRARKLYYGHRQQQYDGQCLDAQSGMERLFYVAENGALIRQTREEFQALWDTAEVVDEAWIDAYQSIYKRQNPKKKGLYLPFHKIQQCHAKGGSLGHSKAARSRGRPGALDFGGPGTGKTYLSAFDVMKLRPRRFLFVVHRELIVKSARASYVKVGVDPADTGLLTGHDKDVDKPYLFATIQTLSRDDILYSFAPDAFDYIVMDEVHHGGSGDVSESTRLL